MFSGFRSYVAVGVFALTAPLTGLGASEVETPVTELVISPTPASLPALRHRLLPLESELMPGDAAPIYLRLTAEVAAEDLVTLAERPTAWLALPLDKFPTANAHAYVEKWRPKLKQIEYGAHRQTCTWNYSMNEDKEHIIDIHVSDAQMLRSWARLVALKARVEIAEHRYDEAVRTIQTGLSFSRHLGDGPFLVNALIGGASANLMFARIEEFVAQPGSPNLYWSLTALPRPFISMRKALANEYKMCEWMLPEMTDLEQPRTEGEWAARLAKFHGRMLKLATTCKPENLDPRSQKLADFRQWVLPEAREFLKARDGKIDGLNEDQMILMFFGGKYRELYDDVYKTAYLPFAEREPFHSQGMERLDAVKQGPLWAFPSLIAAVSSGHRAEAMFDRRIAALRVIEAIRLHIQGNNPLPKSLEDVKVAPIPSNPLRDKPFDYRLSGDTADLGDPTQGKLGIVYRVQIRK